MKKLVIAMIVSVLALVSVGVVAAQGPNGGRDGRGGFGRGFGDGEIMDIIVEATGLEAADLRDALRDGDQTLAELIEANGGDVAEVQAAIVAQITENLPSEEDINTQVEDMLNGSGGLGGRVGAGDNLQQIVEDATGLDVRELLQEARDNDQTLAEVIEANGGDLAAVTEALTAAVTENHPTLDAEQVAERVENFLNRSGIGRGMRGGGRGFGL